MRDRVECLLKIKLNNNHCTIIQSRGVVHLSKDSSKFVKHDLPLESPRYLSDNNSLSIRNDQIFSLITNSSTFTTCEVKLIGV